MSFRDYLHEKAEESRHNETVAYLMFLAGTTFLIGGIPRKPTHKRNSREKTRMVSLHSLLCCLPQRNRSGFSPNNLWSNPNRLWNNSWN